MCSDWRLCLSDKPGALVLFSGGQDSTVCLAHALASYSSVETVGFDYGQRHAVELQCRQTVRSEIRRACPAWRTRLGPDHVLDIASFGAISDTALTSKTEIEMLASGLPSTFVPARNLVFFTYAAALGYRRGHLPVTEAAMDAVISLPIYPELTEAQRDEVVAAVKGFYQ